MGQTKLKNRSSHFWLHNIIRSIHKVLLIIIFLFSILTASAWAIVPIKDFTEPSIQFFRTPDSLFPSGVSDLSLLQETKNQSKTEIWYLIENEFKTKWIPSSSLYFISTKDFIALNRQQGIVTETTATLRLKHGWRDGENIKAGTHVIINSIRSDWSCGIDNENKPLCVASNKVILPIDTISRIKTFSGKWYDVIKRNNNHFVTNKKTFIPISKVAEWILDKNIGFLNNPSTIPLLKIQKNNYIKVLIKEKELRKWNQSKIENHGNVWWQEPNFKKQSVAPIIITSNELQGREIYSKSTSKSKKPIFIASASGIFISKDNFSWKLLSQFGEDNYPVAIGPKNTLIVGDKISFDEGITFQNYLRWDQIALQTQNYLHHSPKFLKLYSINSINPNSIIVQIDTGYKILFFEFNLINNFVSLHDSRLANKN